MSREGDDESAGHRLVDASDSRMEIDGTQDGDQVALPQSSHDTLQRLMASHVGRASPDAASRRSPSWADVSAREDDASLRAKLNDLLDPRTDNHINHLNEWITCLIFAEELEDAGASERSPFDAAQAFFSELQGKSTARVCPNAFVSGDMVFNCVDCQRDSNCVQCAQCFRESDHTGHDVVGVILGVGSGGCCDCGDPTAWSPKGFCPSHGVTNQVEQSLPESVERRAKIVFDVLAGFLVREAEAFAARSMQTVDVEETYLIDIRRRLASDQPYSVILEGMNAPKDRVHDLELQGETLTDLFDFSYKDPIQPRVYRVWNVLDVLMTLISPSDPFTRILGEALESPNLRDSFTVRLLIADPKLPDCVSIPALRVYMRLLVDDRFKLFFAQCYSERFAEMTEAYIDQARKRVELELTRDVFVAPKMRVFALSSQFMNRPEIARDCVREHELIDQIFASTNLFIDVSTELPSFPRPAAVGQYVAEGVLIGAAEAAGIFFNEEDAARAENEMEEVVVEAEGVPQPPALPAIPPPLQWWMNPAYNQVVKTTASPPGVVLSSSLGFQKSFGSIYMAGLDVLGHCFRGDASIGKSLCLGSQLGDFVRILNRVHGMDLWVRKRGDHVLYENLSWILGVHMYSVLLIHVRPMLAWMAQSDATNEERRRTLRSIVSASADRYLGIDGKPVSFILATSRFAASACAHAVASGLRLEDPDDALPPCLRVMASEAIAVAATASEIRAGMWRANGNTVAELELTYSYAFSHCRIEMHDLDALTIQMALLAAEGGEDVLEEMSVKFGVSQLARIHAWEGEEDAGSEEEEDADAEYFPTRVEHLLEEFIFLCCNVPIAGGDVGEENLAELRRFYVHSLAVRPKTYATVIPSPRLGIDSQADALELGPADDIRLALERVAEYKAPKDDAEAGTWSLPDATLLAEFDPYYARHGVAAREKGRERYNALLSRAWSKLTPTARRRGWTSAESCLVKTTPAYDAIRGKILTSSHVLNEVVGRVVARMRAELLASEGRPGWQGAFACALHLLTLALHARPADVVRVLDPKVVLELCALDAALLRAEEPNKPSVAAMHARWIVFTLAEHGSTGAQSRESELDLEALETQKQAAASSSSSSSGKTPEERRRHAEALMMKRMKRQQVKAMTLTAEDGVDEAAREQHDKDVAASDAEDCCCICGDVSTPSNLIGRVGFLGQNSLSEKYQSLAGADEELVPDETFQARDFLLTPHDEDECVHTTFSACSHALHMDCWIDWMGRNRATQSTERQDFAEFFCPMCRTLSNIVVPCRFHVVNSAPPTLAQIIASTRTDIIAQAVDRGYAINLRELRYDSLLHKAMFHRKMIWPDHGTVLNNNHNNGDTLALRDGEARVVRKELYSFALSALWTCYTGAERSARYADCLFYLNSMRFLRNAENLAEVYQSLVARLDKERVPAEVQVILLLWESVMLEGSSQESSLIERLRDLWVLKLSQVLVSSSPPTDQRFIQALAEFEQDFPLRSECSPAFALAGRADERGDRARWLAASTFSFRCLVESLASGREGALSAIFARVDETQMLPLAPRSRRVGPTPTLLLTLPEDYATLYSSHQSVLTQICGSCAHVHDVVLCLQCGETFQVSHERPCSVGRFAFSRHAKVDHPNNSGAIGYLLRASLSVLVFGGHWLTLNSLYLDEHGEAKGDKLYSKAMHLDHARLKRLRNLLWSNRVPGEICKRYLEQVGGGDARWPMGYV